MGKINTLKIKIAQKEKLTSALALSLFLIITISLFTSMISTKSSGIFLDYLYLFSIALAGFWFGLRGGLVTAFLASFIFIAEIRVFSHLIFIDSTFEAMFFRFILFFLAGIGFGSLSDSEKLLKEKLKILAQYDDLTSCYNYRHLMETLETEAERARRYETKLTVAMLDIDYFKNINDTYGHLVGNEILKQIGQAIKSNLRKIDIIGRYGGDEFLAIFPQIDPEQACIALRRISKNISEIKVYSAYLKKQITVSAQFSIGVASIPENANDLDGLLNMADYATYKAKKQGRNTIISEKRKWQRFRPASGLTLEALDPSSKQLIPLELVDISPTGAQMIVDSINKNNEIIVKITFPDKSISPEIQSHIRHTVQIGEKKWKIGFQFTEIDDETREKITHHVETSIV
jgi:diguanylate cyclase (GGDEF)-like protein